MLSTDRLILEPWQPSDWTAFRPIARDPEVMRYITGGAPWNDDQVRSFIEWQTSLYSARGFCRWKVIDRATGALIGFCGGGMWRHLPDPEIGWWLAREFWGRGLATEAAEVAFRDLLDRAGLKRVISIAMVGNLASRRIMEKIGLTLSREFLHEGVQLVEYETIR